MCEKKKHKNTKKCEELANPLGLNGNVGPTLPLHNVAHTSLLCHVSLTLSFCTGGVSSRRSVTRQGFLGKKNDKQKKNNNHNWTDTVQF